MTEQIARTPESVCEKLDVKKQTDSLTGRQEKREEAIIQYESPFYLFFFLPTFCPYFTPMNIPPIKQLDSETNGRFRRHYLCLAVTYFHGFTAYLTQSL